MEGADLDALLEAKYEHDLDDELLQQLQDEEGNDETFGSLSEPLDRDFDFTAASSNMSSVNGHVVPQSGPSATNRPGDQWSMPNPTISQQPGMLPRDGVHLPQQHQQQQQFYQQQQMQQQFSARPPPADSRMMMMMGPGGAQGPPPNMMSFQEMEAMMRSGTAMHGLPMAQAMPLQGMMRPQGMPQGFPQGPQGFPQPMPPQGFPQGMPGMPMMMQGPPLPPGTHQGPMITMEQVEMMMMQARGGAPPMPVIPAAGVVPHQSAPQLVTAPVPAPVVVSADTEDKRPVSAKPAVPLFTVVAFDASLQDSSSPHVKPKKAHFERIHRPTQQERRIQQQQQLQLQGEPIVASLEDLTINQPQQEQQPNQQEIRVQIQQRPRRDESGQQGNRGGQAGGRGRGPRDYQHHQHQGYNQQLQREFFGNGYQQQRQQQYQQQGGRGGARRNTDNERSQQDRIPREEWPREQQYRGLMMQWEKEFIAKIQISQLVSERPFVEDFYYQIYTTLAKNAATPSAATPSAREDLPTPSGTSAPAGTSRRSGRGSTLNTATRMQRQMERLIEKRKQRPKVSGAAPEGALGKISTSSSRNPRQALSINPVRVSEEESSRREFTFSPHTVLRSIEKVYDNVLELEQLMREADDVEDHDAWCEKQEKEVADLWKNLGLAEPVSFSLPHPFGFLLKYSKGMRVIPRAIKFLTRDQIFALFNTLLARLECIEISNTPASDSKEEVDMFMNYVIPCLVDFVSEEVLSSINELMKTVLERHNMLWMAKSRMGLALLTMFLSRAEILKQAGSQLGKDAPTENDIALWGEIYNFLFASLEGQFASLFTEPGVVLKSYTGEIYIWQFLASLAVGATSVDQQRVLVTEVRSNIIATAKRESDAVSLANVNLFLNALGLGIDASQLAAMAS